MRIIRRLCHWTLWLLLVATFLSWSASMCMAQISGATITGRVIDPKGNVVPDATVVAKNVDTGIERTAKSTSEGLYRFDGLPPGFYDLSVEVAGFAKALAKAVKLQVGEVKDVNFTLSIGAVTETVTVTAALPLVQTTKTDSSSLLDAKQVAVLPTTTAFTVGGTAGVTGISNDWAGLAASVPGVKYDFTSILTDLVGPGGLNGRGNLVNVDGANISDQVVSVRDVLGASLEEVKEFQVITNNYNAEYGQAGALILNVITKSGSNGFHGDAHGYFRGRNLTANTFFYNQSPEARFRRAPFHKQEGGFTAGGPFVKDRSFWFVSLERAQQGSPLTLTPPGGPITVQQPTTELLWSAKWDHQITKKHHLTVRYNVQRDLTDNLLVQVPNTASPESLVSSKIHDNTLNVGMVSTPTPSTVNEARFAWHRFLTSTPDKTTQPGQFGPNFYKGAAFCCPQGGLQHRFEYIDNLSWTHGTHTVKTGFNISHFPYNSLFQQFHFGRYESFKGTPLLPTQFTIGVGPGFVETTDNIYGLYLQDSWQIRRNFTLNYGYRYDLEDGAFTGGRVNKRGSSCFQGNGIIPACSSDRNNIQPRVGIAWSPNFQSGFLHALFGDPGKSVIRASFAEVTMLAFLNVSLDSLNFDGTNLFTVSIKDPSVLAFFPNAPSQAALAPFTSASRTSFGRVRPIAPDLRNPEFRHANLTISRQIGANLLVDFGYTGVFGFGLFGERDRNFPAVQPDPAHPGFFFLGPRPDPRFAAERVNENSRTSTYHGFTASATKRLSHHFQFQAGYALSKLLATTEDFFGISEPGDPRNIRADRALAQNDVRHQGNFSVVLDTERVFSSAFVRHLFNDWTFGFIGQLQSGRPYPISTGDGAFAGSIFGGVGSESNQRPNILSDGTLSTTNIASASGTNLLISQAAVAQCLSFFPASQCPAQTTFLAPAGASGLGPSDSFTADPVDFQFLNGNLVRNAGHSRPFYRFDLSVMRAFRIPRSETMRLELRAEFFNVFNHTNFLLNNSNDVTNVLSIPTPTNSDGTKNAAFASARSCTLCINPFTGFLVGADGRVLKLSDLQNGRVSSDIQNSNWGGLGEPGSTDIARTIQLSIRFRW